MIHGIYVRSKPKNRWRLISTTVSGELALRDKDFALEKAKKEGFENAEAAIQLFENSMFVPESLVFLKAQDKILFN